MGGPIVNSFLPLLLFHLLPLLLFSHLLLPLLLSAFMLPGVCFSRSPASVIAGKAFESRKGSLKCDSAHIRPVLSPIVGEPELRNSNENRPERARYHYSSRVRNTFIQREPDLTVNGFEERLDFYILNMIISKIHIIIFLI